MKVVLVAMPVSALAAMGLVFLWCCPEVKWQTAMLGAHHAFWRQLVWNAAGIAAFCALVKVGWRRVLKAAPYVAAAWVVMLLVAELLCPKVNGELYLCHKSIGVGIKVMSLLPFVAALAFAWFSDKFKVKARHLLMLMTTVFLLVMTARIALDPVRVDRIKTIFRGEALASTPPSPTAIARYWAQKATTDALGASRWLAANEAHLKENPIPGRFTFAMPASAALAFGKWFLVLVGAAFGLLGWCFARAWFSTADQGRKTFVAISGLGVFVPAIMSVCGCLDLMPMMYACVPLASYGGTAAIGTWLITGALAALSAEESRDIVTKQAEIELAGQAAARNRPPIQDNDTAMAAVAGY